MEFRMSTALVMLPERSQMRNLAYALLLVPVPIACIAAELTGLETVTALCVLAGGVFIGTHATDKDGDVASTIFRLFFVVAPCHAAIGYAIAEPTSRLIWIGSNAPNAYAQAFLVISAGFFCAAIGYAIFRNLCGSSSFGWLERQSFSDRRVVVACRLLIIPGIVVIAVVYARLGIIPLLADSPGVARYFTYQMSDDYLFYEWLVSRGMDLLTFALPVVAATALSDRRWVDRLLAVAGAAAVLLPLRRANLMSIVVAVVLMSWMKEAKSWMRYATLLLVLLLGYAASQLIFIDLLGLSDLDDRLAFTIAGSALPEVRDLGWTIDLLDGDRLNGSTFVQALVPLPSFVSDFSQTHSLRAVTSRLIGLDAERRTGGLRLTLFGEAFLNFGYVGPVLCGFLFGVLCAWVHRSVQALSRAGTLWGRFVAATLVLWVCMWLYLGGTQSAATLKMGALLLTMTLFLSGRRFGGLSKTREYA
jgi:hypothetical protein